MKLIIEQTGKLYKVTQEDGKYASDLDFSEMIGIVIGLSQPDGLKDRYSGWMRTEEQNRALDEFWLGVETNIEP
jgi:hypothetical protein